MGGQCSGCWWRTRAESRSWACSRKPSLLGCSTLLCRKTPPNSSRFPSISSPMPPMPSTRRSKSEYFSGRLTKESCGVLKYISQKIRWMCRYVSSHFLTVSFLTKVTRLFSVQLFSDEVKIYISIPIYRYIFFFDECKETGGIFFHSL